MLYFQTLIFHLFGIIWVNLFNKSFKLMIETLGKWRHGILKHATSSYSFEITIDHCSQISFTTLYRAQFWTNQLGKCLDAKLNCIAEAMIFVSLVYDAASFCVVFAVSLRNLFPSFIFQHNAIMMHSGPLDNAIFRLDLFRIYDLQIWIKVWLLK